MIEFFDVTLNVNQQTRTVRRRNDSDEEHRLHDRIVAVVEAQVERSGDLLAELFGLSVFLSVTFGLEVSSRIDTVVFVDFSARFQHGRAQFLRCLFVSFHDLPVENLPQSRGESAI